MGNHFAETWSIRHRHPKKLDGHELSMGPDYNGDTEREARGEGIRGRDTPPTREIDHGPE